jgi:chromosome segregation ATPase
VNDFSTFATLLLAVITLGAAFGIGFQRGKIAKLRGERDEERDRADRADARADRHEAEVKKLEEEVHSCREELEALGRAVRHEAEWIAVGDLLDRHHAEAKEHWQDQSGVLKQIAEIVEAYRR